MVEVDKLMNVDTVTVPPEYCTSIAFGRMPSRFAPLTLRSRVSVPVGALANVNAAAWRLPKVVGFHSAGLRRNLRPHRKLPDWS